MLKELLLGALVVAAAISLPLSAVIASASSRAAADAEVGVCTALGCRSGNIKCADGTYTTSGGHITVNYTCWTTIDPV